MKRAAGIVTFIIREILMLNTTHLLDHFTTLSLNIFTFTRNINTTCQNDKSITTHTYRFFKKASKFARSHIKNNFRVQNLQGKRKHTPRRKQNKQKANLGRKPSSFLAAKDLKMQDIWYRSHGGILFFQHLFGHLYVKLVKKATQTLTFHSLRMGNTWQHLQTEGKITASLLMPGV